MGHCISGIRFVLEAIGSSRNSRFASWNITAIILNLFLSPYLNSNVNDRMRGENVWKIQKLLNTKAGWAFNTKRVAFGV